MPFRPSNRGIPRARARHVVVALAVVLTMGVGGVAHADTASDLQAARRRLAEAQSAAKQAAADIVAGETRLDEISERIAALQDQVKQTRRRERELVAIVRTRARNLYSRSTPAQLTVVINASGPLQAARRMRFVDVVNRKDNNAIRKLSELRADLRGQQNDLGAARDREQSERDQLASKHAEIQANLASAAKLRDALVTKLETERAAAVRQAAVAREAALLQELAQLRPAPPPVAVPISSPVPAPAPAAAAPLAAPAPASPSAPTSQPAPPPPPPAPSTGPVAFYCPVFGSAYTDNYGPRGSSFHYGLDMFAPSGAPLYAVRPGNVRYVPNEGAGGNTAYLYADNGNVYFYAHLSTFVGGPRGVGQGEVIGRVGATGNASGPHLHFEIRLGGVNGERINPYPTVRGAGC